MPVSHALKQRQDRKLRRMQEAWELVARGWTQAEIAEKLAVSRQAVQQLVKQAEAEVLLQVHETVLRQKLRQTHRLEGLYREAMASWSASKGDVQKRTIKQSGAGAESKSETSLVIEQSQGNPAYLQAAIGIMADLRKVWGLDAPMKLTHSVADPASVDLARLSDDELERYQQLLAKMEGRA